jgi:asparagine synthase (glutamine-hydrolysing)
MPGIFGIINKKPNEEIDNHLHLMLEPMLHEPFYSSGIYSNRDFGVNIGWVCHDNSFAIACLFGMKKKDIVLLFYGENFPDVDLFDNLKARNHHFSRHNASYIIHLYEEYGTAFLNQLNGRFSGILFDINLDLILLFNDRYGIQRIFYTENKKWVLFFIPRLSRF